MSGMTRRSFLGDSAKAVAGASVLGGLARHARAQAVPASEKVRVGLIGCGGMGRGDLETFFKNPEIECPIICDVDDAMLAKAVELVEGRRGHAPETVKDFRRVIDREDVDVVIVATPDHWHALPTVYACQAGKDVYVEKPLGRTIDEGRAMLEGAKRHERVVQMGTQWHSGPHYTAAIDYVHSGKLGKVRMVRAWAYLDWLGGIGHQADC
ncbi:MAG TPA: Gfo/Idh/MocA family oxidoreductase, partial [Candidatus Hydrogenedentes bacterium]|nr:Gfo/Idh/MocA family oxidoreductase [Candidatus Hydrogenedentota bacterium]